MKTLFLYQTRTLLVAALLPLATVAAAESPSLLLQKGIYAEEIERNLDSAIKIYEQIAAEAAASRAVVAQAQYRLAVCYQKQGRKEEAIKVLQELAQSTSDSSLKKKAQDALAEMGELPYTKLAIRKIPLPIESGWFWDVSRDGRFVSYSPMANEDVAVGEISTGKTWTIFKGEKGKEEPWSYAKFSPDGTRVSIDVSNVQRSKTGNTIYVVNSDGTGLRKVFEVDVTKESVTNLGWSADGNRLIVVIWNLDPKVDRIVVALDARTGTRTELARVPNVGPKDGTAGLSPNGRYVSRSKPTYPRAITFIDLNTGRETPVIEKDAGRVVGWAPGESRMLFTKQGAPTTDLWAASIVDGKVAGELERVWVNFDADVVAGTTQAGDIYYGKRKRNTDPYELWVIEGVLSQKAPAAEQPMTTSEISPTEIVGPNNSILDRKFGVSVNLPAGWTIQSAELRKTVGSRVGPAIFFKIPEAGTVASLAYVPITPWPDAFGFLKEQLPKPTTSAEIDAWLLKWARARSETLKQTNYQLRGGGFIARIINGQRALSWEGRFEKNGEKHVEFLTTVFSEKILVLFWLRVPVARADAFRPAFEEMVASLRLPE